MSRLRGWSAAFRAVTRPGVVGVVGAALLLSASQAFGQGATITGRVTSEQGAPLELANLFIAELSLATVTDDDGRYTLTIPAQRVRGQEVVLQVRRIGFLAQTRSVVITAGSQTYDFALRQDVNRLSEIVITGAMEQTERAKVGFSVGRVSQADMPVPALDPLRSLSGKVTGVRIAQTGGQPGDTPEILLRGPTSINGQNRGQGPLIIIDGAIMNVGSIEELGGLDIESVEVVKGAAGASMYGTRAANGVIEIRTKRGADQDGVRFGLRTEYGFSDLNSLEYGMPLNHHLQLDETGTRFCVAQTSNISACSRTTDWMTEIMRINGVPGDTVRSPQSMQWNSPSFGGGALQNTYQANQWPGRRYNTMVQMLRRNPVALTQLDATGRVGGVRFYVSGSYQNEEGAIRNLGGIQHRRARVNLDYEARSDLQISVSTMFDNSTRDLRGSFFGQLLRGAPPGTDYLATDSLGRPIIRGGGSGLRGTGNGGGQFLYSSLNAHDDRNSNRFLGSISASYFPMDWVTFDANFAYDSRNRLDETWVVKGFRTFNISTGTNNGNIALSNNNSESMNGSVSATLRRQLTSDLHGRVQFRALYDERYSITNNGSGEVFLVRDVYNLDNVTQDIEIGSGSSKVKNVGLFAGTTLDYKDRYIVDGTFRYDGSSLFGSGNRWAPFSRVSFVWRASEEPFWNVPYLNDFRIRASRGTAGSTPQFDAQYETYNVGSGGITLGQAGNSQLRPETTTEYEVGTDFTLIDRLGVELTFARSTTEDQILNVPTPASFGFGNQWQNAGTLQNTTWELALNLPVITRADLQWSMRASWDRTRTYITELFAPDYVTNAGTNQGSGGFFVITDSREKNNGVPMNRYGNIWGRRFYASCGDLPSAVQSDCGPGREFQVNDEGWVVWVGEGNHWGEGITKNLWTTQLAAADSPWNFPLTWGHPIIDRPLRGEPGEGIGINQILGNVFPDFRFGWSNNIQYKRLSVYALFEGTIGHDIYNQGEAWGLLDFNSNYFDQSGKSVETAKPVGYGWRVGGTEGGGSGGFYDQLGVNNYNLEDGSFVKVREFSVSYQLGSVGGLGDWTFGVVGRNLFTFTDYTGYDPETGAGAGQAGSGLINQVDAFGFPTLRTFTFSVSSRF